MTSAWRWYEMYHAGRALEMMVLFMWRGGMVMTSPLFFESSMNLWTVSQTVFMCAPSVHPGLCSMIASLTY